MGALLLTAGQAGKRFTRPNSRIMIHQPLGGAQGQATDIEIQSKEILRMRQVIKEMISEHTKKPIKQVEKDTDRDFFMSPKEAADYGLIDTVIDRRPVHSV